MVGGSGEMNDYQLKETKLITLFEFQTFSDPFLVYKINPSKLIMNLVMKPGFDFELLLTTCCSICNLLFPVTVF